MGTMERSHFYILFPYWEEWDQYALSISWEKLLWLSLYPQENVKAKWRSPPEVSLGTHLSNVKSPVLATLFLHSHAWECVDPMLNSLRGMESRAINPWLLTPTAMLCVFLHCVIFSLQNSALRNLLVGTLMYFAIVEVWGWRNVVWPKCVVAQCLCNASVISEKQLLGSFM